MLNNKDKEKIFDSVLSCAFEQAVKEEIDEMPDNSELAKLYQPTERLRRDVDKIINKPKPKRTHPAWRRVAIAAMIVICVTLGTAMATPQIRAGVKEAVVDFFDKYTSFSFDNTNVEIDLGNGYTMRYLPEGYEFIEKTEMDNIKHFIFSNKENNQISLSVTYSCFIDTLIDNEESNANEVTINEFDAYIITPYNSDKKTITWGNNEITFFLSGVLQESELILIAENIK